MKRSLQRHQKAKSKNADRVEMRFLKVFFCAVALFFVVVRANFSPDKDNYLNVKAFRGCCQL